MEEALDSWLDIAGLVPPLPREISDRLFAKTGGLSASHTFLPSLVTRDEFDQIMLPELQKHAPAELLKFITGRVKATFELRHTLKTLRQEIIDIVGTGNFSALWLDREAFSADSMEHRALITEAVIHVYSSEALQKIVALLYQHKVPMIPYGEGGGYNMGVTPMAPAVTISCRGIDHISEIRPSRRCDGKFEVSVGAGVPFKDLVAYLHNRGYVLRCDPNTPRAATGGIAATGSNGGRKAFEVIVHGRAVTGGGTAVCFEADAAESKTIEQEPFLLARKFFSITDVPTFKGHSDLLQQRGMLAKVCPSARGIQVPLQGMKAHANMLAQRAQAKHPTAQHDAMAAAPCLPISAFVGAEGSTGFIYEVTFEIELPLPYLKAARWHFTNVEAAMAATKAIKALPSDCHPEYFELLSGHSIRRFLLQDFPGVFSPQDEAVLILAIEGASAPETENRYLKLEHTASVALADGGYAPQENFLRRCVTTSVLEQAEGIEEFEIMRKPREELPKKLRTKCKTDMEIRTEYLGDVLRIVDATQPRARAGQKQDVLFGHLTPNHTAIIHWNIGGFDLYDEEQADIAWDYLERVIGQAQALAPADDPHGSARFTGEHGVAGKAPFLWLNYIPPADFERMCAVKDILDPQGLFNPDTLFLRTTMARSLRARLLNTSAKCLTEARQRASARSKKAPSNSLQEGDSSDTLEILGTAETKATAAMDFAVAEGLRCTRCNSCKICPVIDAEHELRREGKANSKSPVLPSKRNILMFMERMAVARRTADTGNGGPEKADRMSQRRVAQATRAMFKESASLLKKCFYCRRCDKACPVDIQMHPLMRAYHDMGHLPGMGSKLWNFVYERLMGDDKFKALTYRVLAFFMLVGRPFLALVRSLSFLPDWIKSYTVPPTLALAHYEPTRAGRRLQPTDNFVVISKTYSGDRGNGTLVRGQPSPIGHPELDPGTIYIRYRGCMDTFGKPEATSSVDTYFKEVLGARIVDLEKKMCCGFPFEADGLHERALQSQFVSMVEIAKCIARLVTECRTHALGPLPRFVVFSNCPTCCEAIREMKDILKNPERTETLRARAGLSHGFDFSLLAFDVLDTAEIAMALLKKSAAAQGEFFAPTGLQPQAKHVVNKTVGLKVPCHNTKAATAAQLELLSLYFTGVAAYDRCCGLSGTGRLKHPKIGTKIAEKLFEQIAAKPAEVIVSGCPSCRDGVSMQREILASRKEALAEFEVSGIFEQIVRDCGISESGIAGQSWRRAP